LPKSKSAFDIGFGAFQNLRHRADRKIDVLFLAKEQAVEIDFYGEPVGFGQIFSYELIFDGNVRIAVEVFRKRTKSHKGSSSRERACVNFEKIYGLLLRLIDFLKEMVYNKMV
jgi:hypothetical protein